ncbi:MAG TPA: response regulator [Thermoanaerobaculia bacterium]|jgi:DNA-binding response OmpR family regulator
MLKSRGVLVVDDDVALRSAIVRKLVADGVRADVAQNADDAIRLLDESKYDVVLLDWMLPDGDGGRVVSHLRDAGATRPERVVIMTAAEPRMLHNIDRSMVKGVLFKPLDLAALTAHVRALLS